MLAADLRERIGPSHRNIEVIHFLSWVARQTGFRKRDGESFDDYESRAVAAMLAGIDQYGDIEKYDAILIDEGHDFAPEWLRCVSGMLRGGPDGDLLIAVDGAQSLYGRARATTWKSVGIRASGRSHRLSRSYRNTKQILEFAWRVAQSTRTDGETETHVRVVPTKARRQGELPSYLGLATFAEEHDVIARLVAHFRSLGLADREIAVLHVRKSDRRATALRDRLARDVDVAWISDPTGSGVAAEGVRLSTIHGAKGLEFAAVIVSGVDQLPNSIHPDVVRDENLLYVGLTRAIDHLAVTWAGRSEFTDRIPRSRAAREIVV